MEEQKNPEYNDNDPDVWVVANLVVSTVAMFAQLACLKLQAKQNATSGLGNPHTMLVFEKLQDSIQTAVQHVEGLIRVLSRAGGDDVEPLRADFRFGAGRAYFDPQTFDRYRELVSQIALDASHVSTWTLQMIRVDPNFAATIAASIAAQCGSVQERINALFIGQHSNESVLEECLSMLRTFNNMLGQLERSRN
ncbi:hypothetical protein [Methylocystis suflitae]|uniref:hypothetical protein n=1 Tax=Methylocystis suflitae TaxID=2951405 RepID=UPI00210D6B10|nr:hypothetical protein [Methylocystis suflitae]MCQ4189487.1 hypothetical protein [Methylocystis suflitae]